jgi:hypothetical protein
LSASAVEDDRPRVRVGLEREPVESPCPGCGAYYFDFHEIACEYEERPHGESTHWELDDND